MAVALAALVAGCRVDAIAPINLSDVEKAGATKEPIEVTARLLLTFTSRHWCEDMGMSLVMSLRSSGLNVMPVSCTQVPGDTNWHGELRMPLRLAAASTDKTESNGVPFASLKVGADAENTGALSVTAQLDGPRLNSARERLLEFPAAQDNEDARALDLSVTIMLRNDLARNAALRFDAMTAEADTELDMPAGGTRTISLSPAGLERLLQQQSVRVFSVTVSRR